MASHVAGKHATAVLARAFPPPARVGAQLPADTHPPGGVDWQLGSDWLRSMGFDALASHAEAVETLPAIAAYLRSGRLMPSYEEPDYNFVADKWAAPN